MQTAGADAELVVGTGSQPRPGEQDDDLVLLARPEVRVVGERARVDLGTSRDIARNDM